MLEPVVVPAADRLRRAAPLRLTEVPPGRVARLAGRDLTAGEAQLLAAMGLTEGCRIVVRASGDPTIVEVRTTRIGLARSVAERLLVEDVAAEVR
jgi:Fe2+ transport system protein FeoA